MASSNVRDVADYLITEFREAGEYLTNLKLQKLVYYAQAWHLALYDELLFDSSFEAWVHGPVCPALYHRFKGYRWEPITENITRPSLDAVVEGHLNDVMEAYGGLGAWELERLVHKESPWLDARGELPSDAICETVIPTEAMKAFYRARIGTNGQDSAS